MTKEALKLALELVQRFIECDGISSSDYLDVRDAIKKALAQPEQEPVAWAMLHDNGDFIDAINLEEHARVEGKYKHPLYLMPSQPSLTDDLYNELLFAVGNKYPNETRHQTALRYIQQAEMKSNQPAKAAHGIFGVRHDKQTNNRD